MPEYRYSACFQCGWMTFGTFGREHANLDSTVHPRDRGAVHCSDALTTVPPVNGRPDMTRGIRKTFKHLALATIATLFLATAANAQQASGNIVGKAVAGDTVVVQGNGTGFHRELTIKKDGKYNLRAVPAGEYLVDVKHADGTAAETKAVVVRVGSTARVQ